MKVSKKNEKKSQFSRQVFLRMSDLPDEIWEVIAESLTMSDLFRLKTTNKMFHKIYMDRQAKRVGGIVNNMIGMMGGEYEVEVSSDNLLDIVAKMQTLRGLLPKRT
jgi:hypothetical protein